MTDWVMSQCVDPRRQAGQLSTINQVLQKIGATEAAPGHFAQNPAFGQSSARASASTPGNASPAQYLLHHGITQLATYQPASRFWPFQWIEGGWLLALSLLLIAATVWLVRRRAA
jgi:hypothetical protein